MPKPRSRSKFQAEGAPVQDTDPSLGIETIRQALIHSHELYIVKSTGETVNNSTTLQDDDELFFPVLANEIWDLEGVITYDTGTAPDFKWALSIPGSGTAIGVSLGLQLGAAGTGTVKIEPATETGVAVGGLAVNQPVLFRLLVTVGNADGNVIFQWAQNTLTAANTIVRAGSYLIARKVS